jgi:DNA-binding NarL/FixJ family response regulator
MRTVIVADDSPIQRDIARSVFSALPDFKVIGAYSDGKQALEAIKTYRPDLAFIDYAMPQMTGAEVVEAVKALKLPTKCIFATSMGQQGGAYAHDVPVVIKPYSPALVKIALYKAGLL